MFLQLSLLSLLSFLCLLSSAVAEETLSTTAYGDAWKYGTSGGIIGFIVLILDILVFSKSCFFRLLTELTLYLQSRS